MKIVILDGNTIHPGDLSWAPFEALGELKAYPNTRYDDVAGRVGDAEFVITSKLNFDKKLIDELPNLKYIGVIATGFNNIDLKAAKAKGIVVTNIPKYCEYSVAQMVFAHILELANRVGHHSEVIKDGKWCDAPDFCFWDYPQIELHEKTLGIVGLGNIGSIVANVANQFGMKIIAHDHHQKKFDYTVEYKSLEEVLKESDFISLHCPLTKDTRHMINMTALKKMKKSAYLINTSRGPLVNEVDLANALNEGVIAGAGLDVLNVEPPARNNPLYEAKNCHLTPHISFATKAARTRLIKLTAENLKAFMDGKPINVVS
jgi:glycerate dehydrogenase